MRKKMLLLVAAVALSVLVFAAVAAASGSNAIVNGDFETGSFAPWTTFTTSNGTIGNADVESFDTTGNGASLAAHFNVGDVIWTQAYEGGGISQTFSGTPYTLSADIAADPPTANNSCGYFELLLDGVTVDSHNFGSCSTTVRWHLSAVIPHGSNGTHTVAIRITRPYTITSATPSEYVDNVKVGLRLTKAS